MQEPGDIALILQHLGAAHQVFADPAALRVRSCWSSPAPIIVEIGAAEIVGPVPLLLA
jgi:hypothetical protein